MLLSGVSGLSSTIGCRVCRDCQDCRATVGVSLTVHARGACREIYYSLSGAVGLLSGLSGVGAVGTVERLSGSCRVRVSECRARAQAAFAHTSGFISAAACVSSQGGCSLNCFLDFQFEILDEILLL